jgi:hypothetical protein
LWGNRAVSRAMGPTGFSLYSPPHRRGARQQRRVQEVVARGHQHDVVRGGLPDVAAQQAACESKGLNPRRLLHKMYVTQMCVTVFFRQNACDGGHTRPTRVGSPGARFHQALWGVATGFDLYSCAQLCPHLERLDEGDGAPSGAQHHHLFAASAFGRRNVVVLGSGKVTPRGGVGDGRPGGGPCRTGSRSGALVGGL